MVDHAPLPYVTPAFIASLKMKRKDREVVECAKVQAHLNDIKRRLDDLAKEASTPERAELFRGMADHVGLAVAISEEFARAVKAGR